MPRITTESGKGGNCKDEEELAAKNAKGAEVGLFPQFFCVECPDTKLRQKIFNG
jgi:hypothetical protein